LRCTVYIEEFVTDPSQVQWVQRNTYERKLWNYNYKRPVWPPARRIEGMRADRQIDRHREIQTERRTD